MQMLSEDDLNLRELSDEDAALEWCGESVNPGNGGMKSRNRVISPQDYLVSEASWHPFNRPTWPD